jgi:hypothetical protein
MPRGEPTTTSTSPPRRPNSGPGPGFADPTIDTPVRERASVSPIVRPWNGEAPGRATGPRRALRRPVRAQPGLWPPGTRPAAPRASDCLRAQSNQVVRGVRILALEEHQLPHPGAVYHADTGSVLGDELVPDADSGQPGLGDDAHETSSLLARQADEKTRVSPGRSAQLGWQPLQ